jgi:hypothetical protein
MWLDGFKPKLRRIFYVLGSEDSDFFYSSYLNFVSSF